MSLDVYLYGEPETVECVCQDCNNIHTKTIVPDLYSANVTHNLKDMAYAANIYEELWEPEKLNITRAGELIPLLKAGLVKLKNDPVRFMALNPKNGWGSYAEFVPWIEHYLGACIEYPNATIRVSR